MSSMVSECSGDAQVSGMYTTRSTWLSRTTEVLRRCISCVMRPKRDYSNKKVGLDTRGAVRHTDFFNL